MRIITYRNIIPAFIQDECSGSLRIIRGEICQIHRHGDRLLLSGRDILGFFKIQQLDGGFFNMVFLVVIRIWRRAIHLNNRFARHIAGILCRDR